jgi:hypothetical protein
MTDLAGYLASTMVLLTFMAKDVRLLRALAIFSNIAFITYGVLAWLPPVFCLHLQLFPVNVLRLRSLLVGEGLPAASPALINCHNVFWRLAHRSGGARVRELVDRRRAGFFQGGTPVSVL